jgi:hypothetical protein
MHFEDLQHVASQSIIEQLFPQIVWLLGALHLLLSLDLHPQFPVLLPQLLRLFGLGLMGLGLSLLLEAVVHVVHDIHVHREGILLHR